MNDLIQNKLLQYAPEPPEGAWDAIADALDRQGGDSAAARLFAYEAAPPAASWDRIAAQLDSGTQITPAPVRSISRVVKTAVAAAAIFLLVFTGTRFLGRNSTATAVQPGTSDAANTLPIPSPNSSTGNTITAEEATSSVPDKGHADERTSVARRTTASAPRPRFRAVTASLFGSGFLPQRAETRKRFAYNAPPDNYMVFSDGNGKAVKLPKKLFDFFSCVEEDVTCRSRMQQLQQKLAATSISADFTGVMEILRNLKENQ